MPPVGPRDKNQQARRVPSVNLLMDHPAAAYLLERYPRSEVVGAIRSALADYRSSVLSGLEDSHTLPPERLIQEADQKLLGHDRFRLQRVINATGIVIHTNLGRSLLAKEAVSAVQLAALQYSNLEFDLDSGKRGKRADGAERALCRLTGAESAAVVNNNAAAVLLALTAVAGQAGSEVIISRGELVEIGGSFRIPDVMRMSGAKLVEVGATNRTYLGDYERAVTPNTRAILRVHPSNYRIVGFTKSVPMRDLAKLAAKHDIVLIEDLGSGSLIDLSVYGLPKEPMVQESVKAGANVITFSGDKLLGGPQAGLIVGRRDLVEAMSAHPLYRALRADKMCLAALDATFRIFENDDAPISIPTLRMLTQSDSVLLARAQTLSTLMNDIPRVTTKIEAGESLAGGGSLPEMALPTRLVTLDVDGLEEHEVAEKLRHAVMPVIGIVHKSQYHLDVRTISDEDVQMIVEAVACATVF